MEDFEKELAGLLNKHSMESESGTPDHALAEYLVACLKAWNAGTKERELWYGRQIEAPPKVS